MKNISQIAETWETFFVIYYNFRRIFIPAA